MAASRPLTFPPDGPPCKLASTGEEWKKEGIVSTKVWSLMYRLGTTWRVVGDAANPQGRKSALEGAATITRNGWRVWVEHHTSGKVLYQNPAEIAHQQSLIDKPINAFAEETVPGFARQRQERKN